MIPGSNLLKMALTIIARQQLVAYQFASRTLNSIGLYDVTYSEPIEISGSFQPVQRKMLREQGLDFQKPYFMFYTDSIDLIDIQRSSSGDLITYVNGTVTQTYQVESANDWWSLDGWTGILCVEVTGTVE